MKKGTPISDERLCDAVDVILARQNADGSCDV